MWGICMAGEGKERKIAKKIVGNKVKGETVPFFPRQRKA